MQEIWQSATGFTLTLGPFLDATDGKTPEEGIDLTTADSAIIFKHGAASASFSIDSATWTSMGSGYYSLAATSSMFDTVGQLTIAINDVSVCLPLWKDMMVIPTAHWQFKYGTTKLTIASVSGSVILGGTNAGAITASSFGAGAIATAAQVASYTWAATASAHAVTNSYGIILGGIPSTTTLASTVAAIVGKTAYIPSASMASIIWNAATADYSVAGSFGGILGALGAGADPWSSTVTAYTGTNTFGLILGGLPSATTLGSVVAGIVGKTSYLTSATVGDWALTASVSGSVYSMASNIWGKVTYQPSSTVGDWTIASMTGSVYALGNNIWNKVTYQPSATVGDYTIASVTGSVYALGTNIWGKTTYLPSVTIGSWSISGVASVSIVGYVASVSGSMWGLASAIWGNVDYLPSLTVGDWALTASVSGSVYQMASNIWGKVTYLPSATVNDWTIGSASGGGADPWLSTVTAYTGTNTFGLILGGIPSATTLASVVAGIAEKTYFLPSSTVGDWTISDVTNPVNAQVGTITGDIIGTIASISSSAQIYVEVDAIYDKLPTKYYLTGTNELDGDLEMGSVVGNFPGAVASVSNSVAVQYSVASIIWSALSSSFGAGGTFGGIVGAMAAGADPWLTTVTAYTGTNTFGLLLGGLPSTTTLASSIYNVCVRTGGISVSAFGVGAIANTTQVASSIWTAATADYATASSMGHALGDAAAGGDPWGTTVTGYVGTNTFGQILGGIPSTTTLASTIAAIVGKTGYLPSATVNDWTIGSASGGGADPWAATVTGYVATNTFGQILGGIPSTTTLASVVAAINGKAYYLPSATLGEANALLRAGTNQMASFNWEGSLTGNIATVGAIASTVWAAATADWATASSMGHALGDAGGGADPWASTVTGYVGTNTFGLILGGIPSATTLASVVAGVAGKTAYLPSVTMGSWSISYVDLVSSVSAVGAIASVSVVGYVASVSGSAWQILSTTYGKIGYLPSVTMGSWSISYVSSVSGSTYDAATLGYGKTSYLPSVTIGSWSISGVASVSIGGTMASVSGSLWQMASSDYGKISYLPSVTIGSWSISGVASVSIVGYVASVSGSAWGVLSTTYGKIDYMPSITMGSWSISYANSVSFVGYAASVSGSAWGVLSSTYGKIDYLPSVTMGSWSISAVASISVAGIVGSVSASVVDAFFEEVVEGTTTFRTSQKYQNAFAAGEATGGGTATVTIRDIADSLDRIKMDVDADGNRSAVTRNDG
jgi:hypothetical protein